MTVPVISLGAGVQSTTLALMAAHGEFEHRPGFAGRPGFAIFADTGWEPQSVYDHLDWLTGELDDYGIEVVRVQEKDLLEEATGRAFNPIPLYMANPDGTASAGRRQCTKEFKLYPIRHFLRARNLNRVEMWVGISLDEFHRMKPSGLKWLTNRWPLIEKQMTREDCKRWLDDHAYPIPPKSACVFCPYKRERDYVEMRDNDPVSFAKAVAADEAMRRNGEYVLASLKPLSEATSLENEGQLTMMDECEGMCGV